MKQTIITLILFLQINFVANAQNVSSPVKNDNGKWGLISTDGSYVVNPKYSEMEDIGNGKFRVALGGKVKDGILEGEKWGIINHDGSVILKTDYDEIGDFINGVATLTKGGKTGFVNSDYKIISEPKYDFVGTMNSQGFVWVNSGGKPDSQHPGYIAKGKYGIINISGDIIVSVSYNSIGYISENKAYHDQSKIYGAKNELERLMLECGSQYVLWAKPIELRPGSMIPESIGFAFSNKANLTLNGITDTEGNVLVKDGIYQRCAMPSDGLALVQTKKNQIGFYDIEADKLMIDPAMRSAFSYSNDVAIGIDNRNKWGFYDKTLTQMGQSYDWISPQIGSFYLVRSGNLMSLLDAKNLTPVVSGKQYIFPPINGLMAYKDSDTGLWGYLNESGETVMTPQYNYAYSFNHGVACVKSKNGWGVVDAELKEIIPTKWENIIFPSTDGFNKVWVATNADKQSYRCWHIGTNGFAFDGSFDDAWNFKLVGETEFAVVKVGDKYGFVDESGNMAIPVEYDSKKIAESALSYKLKHGFDKWQPIHSYRFGTIYINKQKVYTIKDTLPDENWDY